MNEEQINDGISLLDLFTILKKHILIIISCICLCTTLGVFYSFVLTKPDFQSKCLVMVQFNNQSSETSDITNSLRIVVTVAEFMQDDLVLKEASRRLALEDIIIDKKEIKNGLSVSYSSTSLNITVKYNNFNKEICDNVVDTVIESAEYIANNTFNDNGDPYYFSIYSAISQVGSANVASDISTSKPLLMVIFIVIGGVMGVVLAFLKNLLDNTINNKEELEEVFGIQVLGAIPEFIVKKGGVDLEE